MYSVRREGGKRDSKERRRNENWNEQNTVRRTGRSKETTKWSKKENRNGRQNEQKANTNGGSESKERSEVGKKDEVEDEDERN
jgi:hypothetical protein